MKITVLGSGTYQPTVKRGCSGYLIEIDDYTLLLDAGSGTMRQLAHCSVSPADIDYVYLSHLHIDHTGDLIPILFCKKNQNVINPKDIVIFGPKGLKEYLNLFLDSDYVNILSNLYDVSICEFDLKIMSFPSWSIEILPMDHSIESYGIKITCGNKSLAYSGDTGYCDNLVKLCKGVDLAIIECTLLDSDNVSGHLTPAEAGKIAHNAACSRVILTHINPIADESEMLSSCSRYYCGDIAVAKELEPIVL